jgi:hypothetical protein
MDALMTAGAFAPAVFALGYLPVTAPQRLGESAPQQ